MSPRRGRKVTLEAEGQFEASVFCSDGEVVMDRLCAHAQGQPRVAVSAIDSAVVLMHECSTHL